MKLPTPLATPAAGITDGWHELTKSPPIKAGWLLNGELVRKL
jgi:hypothetical protein